MALRNGLHCDQNYDFIIKWMTGLLRGETLDVNGAQ